MLLTVFLVLSNIRNEELKRQRDRADANAVVAASAQNEALTVRNTAVAGQATAEAVARAADHQRILAQALAFRANTITDPETRLLVSIAAAERVPEAQFAGENGAVVAALSTAVQTSPLHTASDDGTARLFYAHLSDLLTRAQPLTRALTPEERRRYGLEQPPAAARPALRRPPRPPCCVRRGLLVHIEHLILVSWYLGGSSYRL